MAIETGQVIGDYEVIGLIGAGGMGEVYKVRNLLSERIDAMKVLRTEGENTPDAAGRFLREIKLQASLKHPNIAVLYTAMRFEDQMLMFMELLDGIGLDQRLRLGSLPVSEAVNYASQCLLALEYAHERGVVHRDIKPSNLMITANSVIKLLDFGIARSTGKDLALTGAGMAIGSAHYMSPEQALGQEVDARSDLYSVGVVLYEMLIGARPFTGENFYAVLKAHVEQEPLSPADLNPTLPLPLCDAVLCALRKDRATRFPNAAAFRAAIHENAARNTVTMPGAAAPRGSAVDSATASKVTALLAREVGPIAAHLVRQSLQQTGDVREACRRLARQVNDETGRRRFLETCERELNLSPISSTGSRTASGARAAAWDPQTLDRVKRALAQYVGPVAKVIVDKAARKCSNLDELYELLAEEIASPADRAKFLGSKS